MSIQEMISTHPNGSRLNEDALRACIEACFECAQTCTACADACLAEEGDMDLRHCIRTDQDCADVCSTTGHMLSRLTQPSWPLLRAQVKACREACKACGEECRRHADHHEHCRVCGDTCKRCEDACDQLLGAFESAMATA